MSLIANSLMVLGGQGAGMVLQFLAGAILARLLTPDEFGAFAVAAGAAALVGALRDFGTSNYLVRAEVLDRSTVGSVLLVTGTLCAVLGGAIALAGPALGRFFADARIELLLYLIAANFLLVPFSLLGNALLLREQRFAAQTGIMLASSLASALAMVLLALAGFGPVALALGTSVSTLTTVVLYARARPRGWALCLSLTHLGSVLRFGGWLTGVSLLSQMSNRLGELVLGKTLGLAAAGLFTKGGSLVNLVSGFAGPVIHVVMFSRVAAESHEASAMRSAYIERLAILSAVAWPAFLFVAIEAQPLVRLAFGAQWGEAVPVTAWLAINAALTTPFLLGDQLLITRGSVADLFGQKLVLFLGRVIVLVGFSAFGLAVVSAALLLPTGLYLWLNQRAVLRLIEADWTELWRALVQPAAVTLAAVAATLVSANCWDGNGLTGTVLELMIAGVAAVLAWVMAALLTRGPTNRFCRALLRKLWGLVQQLRVGRGA